MSKNQMKHISGLITSYTLGLAAPQCDATGVNDRGVTAKAVKFTYLGEGKDED